MTATSPAGKRGAGVEPPDVGYAHWLRGLPKKRISVSGLFLDSSGRILMLSRIYRPGWVLPGGIVESGESPGAAFRREVEEEIGLRREPGRLLCLDWVGSSIDPALDGLVVVFHGGIVSADDVATITPQESEVDDVRFFDRSDLRRVLHPHRAGRMEACLTALAAGKTAYLENGNAG